MTFEKIHRLPNGGPLDFGAIAEYNHQHYKSPEGLWSANLFSDDPLLRARQARATAAANPRASKPAYSGTFSWHPEDRVSREDLAEVMDEWLGEFGLSNHQWDGTPHYDALHYHFHFWVNLVDPGTGKVKSLPFDYHRSDHVCGRLEKRKGWHKTRRIGEVEQSTSRISTRVVQMEFWTDKPSLQRWLGVAPGPDVRRALRDDPSWETYLRTLAGWGLAFDPSADRIGRIGATVYDPRFPSVRGAAGHLGRDLTYPKLVELLGPYHSVSDLVFEHRDSYATQILGRPAPREEEPLYERYLRERGAERERVRALKRERWAEQRAHEVAERKGIRKRRDDAKRRLRGRSALDRSLYGGIVDAKALMDLATLAVKHRRERAQIRQELAGLDKGLTWRGYLIAKAKALVPEATEAVAQERHRRRSYSAAAPILDAFLQAVPADAYDVEEGGHARALSPRTVRARFPVGRLRPRGEQYVTLVGIRAQNALKNLQPAYAVRDKDGTYAIVLRMDGTRDARALADLLATAGAGDVKPGALPHPATAGAPVASGGRTTGTVERALVVAAIARRSGAAPRIAKPGERVVGAAREVLPGIVEVHTTTGVVVATPDQVAAGAPSQRIELA